MTPQVGELFYPCTAIWILLALGLGTYGLVAAARRLRRGRRKSGL
jgi:hypothetical protein